MKKQGKWWKVPAILSAVLGFVPALLTTVNTIYAMSFAAREMNDLVYKHSSMLVAGLFFLVFILAAIWVPTGIVWGIRKLRRKAAA